MAENNLRIVVYKSFQRIRNLNTSLELLYHLFPSTHTWKNAPQNRISLSFDPRHGLLIANRLERRARGIVAIHVKFQYN